MSVEHWQNIYNSKKDDEVSWTQAYPHSAINYVQELRLSKTANIIDIGGGASNFADALLDLGYMNISVLDISEAALDRSKARLGQKADAVTWIVADINEFESDNHYDFWYDRAVFHFLTDDKWIEKYVNTIDTAISDGGHFLLGTFAEDGPLKCSGLEVSRYSESKMKEMFCSKFGVNKCFRESHKTPFDSIQEFQFCGFVKNKLSNII